ncbi:MAG: porin family protein [Candidatus Electrothrix sp. AR4]|nr:porin family protein [Candidatus Electrothrix sp. AR4]
MKRLIAATGMFILLIAGTSHAQGMINSRIGVHGAYSTGGDVEESEAGFGAQAEFSINPIFSIELSVSRFSDDLEEEDGMSIEQDLTTIGLSAVCRMPFAENMHGYLLGGMDYNIIEVDFTAEPAIYNGISVNRNADIDMDNEVGFHVGAGLNFAFQNNWELFTEYRYTFLETEGEGVVSASTMGRMASKSIGGDYDYDFGLLKIGVNYLF